MEIQNRIVFAVELEFTLTSPLSCTARELPRHPAALCYYHLTAYRSAAACRGPALPKGLAGSDPSR